MQPALSTPQNTLLTTARFWEPRRLLYNAVLTFVVALWVIFTWPHFRRALNLSTLPPMFVLALLANLCYCAAYGVDLPLQHTSFAPRWLRSRWTLWLAGTLFAILVECYWIVDEIYPDFS